ncbi:unnamed protein product [Soboliphyme baturini]|uniref:GPI ethanolamine phosphate transferase 2 n=1 Tax=Soboliphyme baturini TaxID=241478 RepID=A0A183I8Y4_9BILA|nr:unnamed protein product [Soboliphyme baturini]
MKVDKPLILFAARRVFFASHSMNGPSRMIFLIVHSFVEKAVVSGIVPEYVDILKNFATSEYAEDSIIRSLSENNRTVVFYGDETWTKLFPHSFARSVPVASFILSDYTEVDQIVTRNMVKELALNDWNVMILHYLGLDHIGHTYGSNSPLISTKLSEMDQIIERLYMALSAV